MFDYFIRIFVDGKSGGDENRRRELCGRMSGAVGIVLNLLLGLAKLFVGIFSGSVAVMADAANNLSDAASSAITLVGFSIANRRSDDEHPFGHARVEYMTGVIVSAFIVVVGVKLITESYGKAVAPTPIAVSSVSAILLAVLILVKTWLYFFNRRLSRLIGSASLKATALDSRNDVVSSAVVLLSLLIDKVLHVHVDGYVGVAVGVFVIYSGLTMVKETAAPLLGQAPDPRTVAALGGLISGESGVLGMHDLIVHDYGPGHVFASVHIEVDSRVDVFASHAMIDKLEQDALECLHVMLVGHMDPVDTQDPKVAELRDAVRAALLGVEGVRGMHDLRIVPGARRTNVIFDVVVAHGAPRHTIDAAKARAQSALTEADPSYHAIVNSDLDYVSGGSGGRGDGG